MRKIFLVIFAAVIAMALIVPSFADEISEALTGSTNATNDTENNTLDNSTVNNTNLTQAQTLNNTQNNLTALIAKIQSLKATYGNNTNVTGLLNALTQFEKQAIKLNTEISALMQNSTANITDGRINSFVKREAALEHKVIIKEQVLQKMSTKQAKNKKVKRTKKAKKDNGTN